MGRAPKAITSGFFELLRIKKKLAICGEVWLAIYIPTCLIFLFLKEGMFCICIVKRKVKKNTVEDQT